MVRVFVRGASKTSFGRARDVTPKELRNLKKTFPSLRFVKVKKRKK